LALLANADTALSRDDYRAARAICAAQGVVNEHLRYLDALMICPGGERLRPVRAVLAGEA
jgi:hypothetical protein